MSRIRALLERPSVLSVIRIAGAGASFLAQLILARVLTAHELGVFYSATSLAMVSAIISAQGYQQIAPRFAVRYQAIGKGRLFGLFVGRSMSDSLCFGLFAAAIIAAGAFLIPGLNTGDRWAFAICGAMVVPITALTICTGLAAALKHFGLCYTPEGLFRPIAFLALLGVLILLGIKISAVEVTVLFAATAFVTAAFVYIAMQRLLPKWRSESLQADRLANRWRREAWPLVLLSLFMNYFGDFAIISATPFLKSSDVAVFGLCLKLALLVGYVVQIAQQMVVPDLAAARRNANASAIESILRRSILVPVIATAVAAAFIAVFGKLVLTLFGPSFAVGQTALLLLVLSQFVRAMAGPSAHLVTLIGAQRMNASLCAGAIVALFLSNLVLVPLFGLLGAALAVLSTYSLWVFSVAYALHGMGEFRTDFFAVFRPRPVAYPKTAGAD
jgi:O-antigen/teichoic acid export membrane protein